jgi:hypothetical protein
LLDYKMLLKIPCFRVALKKVFISLLDFTTVLAWKPHVSVT